MECTEKPKATKNQTTKLNLICSQLPTMKAFIGILAICLATTYAASPYRPAPYHPAPYKPAPAPYKPAPYESYEDEPVYRCPNYPYCDEAPYALSHLQYEIEALRQRAALIDAHGAALARQEPNRPFVGGVYY